MFLDPSFLVCTTETLVVRRKREAPVRVAFIRLCLAPLFPPAEAMGVVWVHSQEVYPVLQSILTTCRHSE